MQQDRYLGLPAEPKAIKAFDHILVGNKAKRLHERTYGSFN